jgi:tripartite-type tricarboxylate transporter receptor subunit TctC
VRQAVYALALAAALTGPAAAEHWPERPVRFIVPYPPGGNADVIGRILAHGLEPRLGQSIIVDNRSGGAGAIGAIAAAHAAPDGYTFLFSANGPILFAPELTTPHPYLWSRDFATVAVVTQTPLVVLVGGNSAITTLDDLVTRARSGAGKVILASGGMASSNHLFSEYMERQLHLQWTTVQYRGTTPALNDLISGQADVTVDQVSSTTPFIAAGTVRALAVTSDHRWPALAGVPTMPELGHPDMLASTFTAMMAPRGTSAEIVATMNAAVAQAVGDPTVRARIEAVGAEVVVTSTEQAEAYLAHESAVWTPIVRDIAARQ